MLSSRGKGSEQKDREPLFISFTSITDAKYVGSSLENAVSSAQFYDLFLYISFFKSYFIEV